MSYKCLEQTENSTVAEHKFETGYSIDFRSTSILDKATRYMDHVIKEATETRLRPRNINRDKGYQPVLGSGD
jgi:hypothetical protein